MGSGALSFTFQTLSDVSRLEAKLFSHELHVIEACSRPMHAL